MRYPATQGAVHARQHPNYLQRHQVPVTASHKHDTVEGPPMSAMLEAALQYGARGWPIFRLSGYKKPLKGSHGFKDATANQAEIEQAWTETPWANIGLATGAIVVFDADGPGGQAELEAICAPHGGIPVTLQAQTARGRHYFFMAPAGVVIKGLNSRRPKGHDGLDIKASGGYVVLPPSVNKATGFVYRWANQFLMLELPPWLAAAIEEKRARERKHVASPAPAPAASVVNWPQPPSYLTPRAQRLVDREETLSRVNELPDFLAALKELDSSCGYDTWFEIGAAIYAFDPGPVGLAIFKAFSWRSERHRTDVDSQACEAKWREYARPKEPGKKLIGPGHIYWLAQEIQKERLASGIALGTNANGAYPPQLNGVSEANGHTYALPAQLLARTPIRFVDFDAEGAPRGTTTNAGIAIENLGISCRKDTFHEKMLVGGHAIEAWGGDLSDDAIHMLRKIIKRSYGFDPGEKNARDAAIQLCLEHQFNPVTDYLDALKWDGRPRVGQWVSAYLSASPTPLNWECGRLLLIAAVRRARRPGTKFDQIAVLEGREGTGKSTALKILAGEDSFSDQNILAAGDKEQQEAFRGVWIHEIAELEGMRRTDVARLKQFASRTEDRARPAYGRIRVDMKRRGIMVATTNESAYLKSETGNRRFWPIETGRIDLEGLTRDRDQLWAEAALAESQGASIELAQAFRPLAGEEQDQRLEEDAWSAHVQKFVDNQKGDVSVSDVLEAAIMMHRSQIGQTEQNRAARILKRLGLIRYRRRDGAALTWRYKRPE